MSYLLSSEFSIPDYTQHFNLKSKSKSIDSLLHKPFKLSSTELVETYCLNKVTKKCRSCNNEISYTSKAEYCSCCDIEKGEQPAVLGIKSCLYCSEDFEMKHIFQVACLKCKPNLLSKVSHCLYCEEEFVRNKDFQLFCDKDTCNEYNYISTFPRNEISKGLLKNTIVTADCEKCNSKFLKLYKNASHCHRCSPTGGELFNYRSVICQCCGNKETTARTLNELLGIYNYYCDSCFRRTKNKDNPLIK